MRIRVFGEHKLPKTFRKSAWQPETLAVIRKKYPKTAKLQQSLVRALGELEIRIYSSLRKNSLDHKFDITPDLIGRVAREIGQSRLNRE